MHFLRRLSLLSAIGVSTLAAHVRPAQACGGCFHEETPPTPAQRSVVTDHRMAFAISQTQTVLWDQIRYAGDPREFAWVLPVRPGTSVELSRDEWFAALDASTQPVISAPTYYGNGYGCALMGCGAQGATGEASSTGDPGQVQLLSQSVVGPYETVTLRARATEPHALETWLRAHGFAVPDTIQPTIDAYVGEGFDFIALRLRPDCGQRAMKPVRIVSPGADPSLPLRMVAAGVGANVGITLYVIGEGRYEPQNFPVASIDYGRLVWDRTTNRSNYDELSQEAMGQSRGHAWIIEYANRPQLVGSGVGGGAGATFGGTNPGLFDGYYGFCEGTGTGNGATGLPSPPAQPCAGSTDAGTAAADSGADTDADSDSGADTDSGSDSGADADSDSGSDTGSSSDTGSASDPGPAPMPWACEGFDDLRVATSGMSSASVWVTRLRAVLPAEALAVGDLRLKASNDQVAVSNYHATFSYADDVQTKETRKACAGAPTRHEPFAPVMLGVAGLLIVTAALRRRK